MAVISLFDNLTSTHARRVKLSVGELFQKLCEGRPFLGTDAHPGWSPAEFDPPKRAAENVHSVSLLCLDYDKGTSIDTALRSWAGANGVLHTTRRHTPEAPRFRMVFELSRAVTSEEFSTLWRYAFARSGGVVDEQPKDASRFWFLPGCVDGGEFRAHQLTGEPLDVDAILRDAAQPAPAPEFPRPPPIPAAPSIESRAINYITRMPGGVSGQDGHGSTWRVAVVLARGFALDEETTYRLLRDHHNPRCVPPWSERELRHKAKQASAARAESGFLLNNGRWSPATYQWPEEPSGDRGTGADTGAGVEVEACDPFRWLDWDAMSTTDLGEVPWVVEALEIGPGRPIGLWGYGGTGKSWIAMALALATAAGRRVFGCDVAQGNVCHVSHEMGRRALMTRYRRLANGMIIDPAELYGRLKVSAFPRVYLNSVDAEEWYRRELKGVKLCIIDSLRRALPGEDENDSSISNYLDLLTRLSDELGTTFIVLHHSGKNAMVSGAGKDKDDDKRGMGRGSSAIFDGSGCVLLVEGKGLGPRKITQIRAHDDGDGDVAPIWVDMRICTRPEPLYAVPGDKPAVTVERLADEDVEHMKRAAKRAGNKEAWAETYREIVDAVESAGDLTAKGIRRAVGDSKKVQDAVKDLVEASVLDTVDGARGAIIHSVGRVSLDTYLNPPQPHPYQSALDALDDGPDGGSDDS